MHPWGAGLLIAPSQCPPPTLRPGPQASCVWYRFSSFPARPSDLFLHSTIMHWQLSILVILKLKGRPLEFWDVILLPLDVFAFIDYKSVP